MGLTQSSFLSEFTRAFNESRQQDILWAGGQAAGNCAAFVSPYSCRRKTGVRTAERFELGDATASYLGWKIIVEFERKELPLSNILKYWPYVRGELSAKPTQPLLICHFSNWWSYATRRDLWEWTLSRMQADEGQLVAIEGKQFDHGGSDKLIRSSSISSAISWIDSIVMKRAIRG